MKKFLMLNYYYFFQALNVGKETAIALGNLDKSDAIELLGCRVRRNVLP